MHRRKFLNKMASLSLGLGFVAPMIHGAAKPLFFQDNEMYDIRKYLSEILYTKEEVDSWLAGKAFPFSKYHSEFGWLLNNAHFRDGVNKSNSIYTYECDNGPRIMNNYKEMDCRINTYGDSFTQCHQVSDHETWQEIIAAHIQEPVRNFGIGAWSVYQSYLRMLTEEEKTPAEYIIFNIFEDDHKRNLDSWRNIRVRKHPQHIESTLPYVKVNVAEDKIIEFPNPCPTKNSLYQLCDLDKAYKLFKDDFVLNIMVTHKNSKNKNANEAYSNLDELIKIHGIATKLDHYNSISEKAAAIHLNAALLTTTKIVEKIEVFAKKHNKKTLYVFSYPAKSIAKFITEGTRADSDFIEFMKNNKLNYVDLLEAHASDFSEYRLEIKDYLRKYFIGHYNPLGNFFCASRIEGKLIKLLNPKPFPYRELSK